MSRRIEKRADALADQAQRILTSPDLTPARREWAESLLAEARDLRSGK